MSWLARSLVSSLRPDNDDEDDEISAMKQEEESHGAGEESEDRQHIDPDTPTRGVKEDISELTKTLTRQFWGVASFLAPPPTSTSQNPTSPPHPDSSTADRGRRPDPEASRGSDDAEADESPRFTGIRSDFAEIGGRFRSGISMLSSNKAVSEISKIASTFLPFGSDEVGEDEEEDSGVGAVGVTDEVLAFVMNVSMHPETWLDFPLLPDDEDSDDFYVSDAQQEHALAIERLAPRLAALRIELCPSHMSEGCFWKIYFVLVHPRLNKHDAEILSTPQIVQARALLLQDLQNQTRRNPARSESGDASEHATLPSNVSAPPTDFEPDKHLINDADAKIIEKSVVKEEATVQGKSKDFHSDHSEISIQRDEEEDGDEWPEEEAGEMGVSGGATIPLGNEEDVSFSDLEDDGDDGGVRTGSKTAVVDPKAKDGSDWIQLNKQHEGTVKGGDSSGSRTKEPNDWLDVDIDLE